MSNTLSLHDALPIGSISPAVENDKNERFWMRHEMASGSSVRALASEQTKTPTDAEKMMKEESIGADEAFQIGLRRGEEE